MTATRTIEVCSNNEWLVVYGPLSDLGLEYSGNAQNKWFGEVCRRLDDLFGYGTAIYAQGQRGLCHGWSGANMFAKKGSGIGTFAEFSVEEWDKAEQIACDVAREIIEEEEAEEARYQAELAAEEAEL